MLDQDRNYVITAVEAGVSVTLTPKVGPVAGPGAVTTIVINTVEADTGKWKVGQGVMVRLQT